MRVRYFLFALLVLAAPAGGGEPDRVQLVGISIARPSDIWRLDRLPTPVDFQVKLMFVSYATDVLKPPSKALIQLMGQVPAKEEGLTDLPDNEARVLVWLERRIEKDRLRMPKHFHVRSGDVKRVKVDRGTCVRDHLAVEDDDWRGPDGAKAYLYSDYLYCPHPDQPSYVVTVRYTYWLAPGVSPPPLADELTTIQNGLRFEPLSGSAP